MSNAELSPKRYCGDRDPRRCGRGRLYLTPHCHHHNDSCIKMGSDDNHFNVSLIVRDKVTRQCLQTTTFEEKGEPKLNRSEVLLLSSLTSYRLAKPAPLFGRNFSRIIYLGDVSKFRSGMRL